MIGAVAPWFGSKRTLAGEIIAQLGVHRCYWEPFCGSLAVLLAKDRATYETANDLHTDLYNLALCLQDEATAQVLYSRTARTLFHEAMLPEAKGRLRQPWELDQAKPDGERAYWYLVFSWMHMNGISGTPLHNTGTFCARYSGKGGNGATRWRSVTESIPEWHERLRGVQMLNRDAFVILEQIDDADGTAIYVDPPYITKGAKYVHDFKSEDHRRLAYLLGRFKRARVVVSYYEHDDLDRLYPGWERRSCAVAKSMVQSGQRDKRGRVNAPEVLLVNGSANGAGLFDEP